VGNAAGDQVTLAVAGDRADRANGVNVENIDIAEVTRRKSANRRVAAVLVSVTCVFFFGIIAARFMGGPTIGISVMGAAVLLFLVVAIGRNLRPTDGGESRGAEAASSSDRGDRPAEAFDPSRPEQKPLG
jgi:hypothetical protein